MNPVDTPILFPRTTAGSHASGGLFGSIDCLDQKTEKAYIPRRWQFEFGNASIVFIRLLPQCLPPLDPASDS